MFGNSVVQGVHVQLHTDRHRPVRKEVLKRRHSGGVRFRFPLFDSRCSKPIHSVVVVVVTISRETHSKHAHFQRYKSEWLLQSTVLRFRHHAFLVPRIGPSCCRCALDTLRKRKRLWLSGYIHVYYSIKVLTACLQQSRY